MVDKKICCGCHACVEICAHHVISWEYDEKGFGYPIISGNCVGCGLCEKVCPMEHNIQEKNPQEQTIYAAYSSEREKSTSGGIAFELSKYIINSQGIVCGVILQEDFTAKHSLVFSITEADATRDSKYIQSELDDIFPRIGNILKTNRKVLFTGTPCQTAALKNYLKVRNINTENLLLCDLICHGVASPRVFRDYIELCQRKRTSKVVGHRFRNKSIGWHQPRDCNKFANGDEDYQSHVSQIFSNIYIDNVCQRESCTHCPFASTTRCSDITIGDFWGIEKIKPEFDDNRGVSLVICNTEKGKQVFDTIKSDLTFMEFSMEEAIRKQPHLQKPLQYGKKYDQFWRIYQQCGFEGVARKMYQYGIQYDLIRSCKNILRPLKKKLKRNS